MFDCRTLFPMPCGPAGIFGRLLFEWKNMVWILYASVVVHGTFVADLVITPSQTLSMGECTGSPLYTIIIHTFPEKSQGQNTPCFWVDFSLINLLSNQNVTQCRNAVEEKIHLPIHLQGHECCSLQMHHGRLQTWGASDAQPGLTAMWILEIQRRMQRTSTVSISSPRECWSRIFAEAWL